MLRHRSMSSARRRTAFVVYPILALLAASILYPLVWMVYSSFKPDSAIFTNIYALPTSLYLENFREVFTSIGLGRAFLNSVLVTTCSVAGVFILASLAAYGFTMFSFRGREPLFFLFILGLVVPPSFLIIASFKLMATLGLLDTYKGLILTYWALMPFAILVLRNFFEAVPKEIVDAARIDGARHLAMYWRIMIPLAKPAISLIVILYFVWFWNDFIYPLVYMQSPDKYTLTVMVYSLSGKYSANWGLQMAGFTVAMLVPVLVYCLFQRQFTRAMLGGSVKG